LASSAGRVLHQDEIDAAISSWCRTREASEIVTALQESGIPAAEVIMGHEITEFEQLHFRGFFESLEHPLSGNELFVGYPARFSSGPQRLHRQPAPMVGQHTHQILSDLLGLDDDAIASLEQQGIIGTRPVGTNRPR
jgi:crotonobetainyl-CoA:carnitine CoA-transferase CaiB-like acyl-CoA transferase